MNWFIKLLMQGARSILLTLDLIVYTLVRIFYNLFTAVSEIRLFATVNSETGYLEGNGLISEVANRIYALIGVYALFKVTFILINMIINPDTVNDKQKGAGKVAVRIVVMLCLTIAVPWIFEIAYKFQSIVLKENVIGTLLIGNSQTTNMTEEEVDDVGQKISNDIFSAFVTIDSGAVSDSAQNKKEPLTASDLTANECEESLNALTNIEDGGIASLYKHIITTYKSGDDEEFCINYTMIISLIAGGFAAYVFAVYCLDIGLRVAKLAFYELIAPVPIATFIDGKKDGTFNNWMKSAISTYADLFLRLIIIYFIILVITKGVPDLMNMEVITKHDIFTRNFAKAIVILGLLMFATQAPKLIKDLFGVKGEGGDYGLNLSQKLGKAAVVGGALSAGASLAGHAVGAGVGKGGSTIKNKGIQVAENLRDKFKHGGGTPEYAKAKELNANNYALRQQAATTQALSRLDNSNYDSKTHKYTGVRSRDLVAQALYGRNSGFKGRIEAAQRRSENLISMSTPEPTPTTGMKTSKGMTITFGNILSQQTQRLQQLQQQRAAATQGLYSTDSTVKAQAQSDIAAIDLDLNWDSSKNWQDEAKSIFESAFANHSLTFDKDFIKGVPNPDDTAKWNEYKSAMQDAVNNILNSSTHTEAEKEQLLKQAETFANNLNERQKKALASGKK